MTRDPDDSVSERLAPTRAEDGRLGGKVKNRLYCPQCGATVNGKACPFCAAVKGEEVGGSS